MDEIVEDPPGETPEVSDLGLISYNEVAKQVLAGHWGRGRARAERLRAAGYTPQRVNEEIDKVLHQ